MRTALLVVLAACAQPVVRAPDSPSELPADQQRWYTIWFGGAQVGTALEREAWTDAGVVLRRVETMRFLRGDAAVELTTTIDVTADRLLVPSHVVWTERGVTLSRGEAVRDRAGWRVIDDRGTRRISGAAVPSELLPLILRRDHRFAGEVFLPARGFVVGHGEVEPITVAGTVPGATPEGGGPPRSVAVLALEGGAVVVATIDLGDDGTPASVVDGEGVIAMRATEAQAQAPFAPVDLVGATSIPLIGARGTRLVLDGDLALPALPGQAASLAATGVELELSARLPGDLPPGAPGADRTREIVRLVHAVEARIAPDLHGATSSRHDARAATSGDCTTFALAYAALAAQRGIPTRVVTGLRVDGARLIRHRWAVSWTGTSWIAVDAAFGAAPAGGDLIGLAIHDGDDAGLIAGEAALTQIRGARWR